MISISEYIDHTLLKPDATENDIRILCGEAVEYSFKSVCVNPSRIELAVKLLKGTEVLPCCVIGFPFGASLSSAKAYEAKSAVEAGAKEIDMVINVGAVKDGNKEKALEDIRAVVSDVRGNALVKVIIETCLLSDEEKRHACECAMLAGADFVKTSTGFSKSGATEHDIVLMRSVVGNALGVKASGGIRTLNDALVMIRAGASRIGTSNGVSIAREMQNCFNNIV